MKYNVTILWEKGSSETFTDNKYSRVHTCKFDGDIDLRMSASPQVVPLPMSEESAADPEEIFVAAISSCHMLFFLSIAAANKFTVEKYEDNAEGQVSKNEEGKLSVTSVTLKPTVTFLGNLPGREQVAKFHEMSHDRCYIANSVKTKIEVIQQ